MAANKKDIEYAQNMIPHHQMALKMSAALNANGKDEELRKFALSVFSAQTKEIAWLKEWLKKNEAPEKGAAENPKM